MDIFRRRPFMLCCGCFIAVTAAAFCVLGWVKLMFAAAVCGGLVTAIIALCVTKNKSVRTRTAVAAIAALMMLGAALESYFYFDVYSARLDKLQGTLCEVEAVVISEDRNTENETLYSVRLLSVNGEEVSGTAKLLCEYRIALRNGTQVSFVAECVPIEELTYSDAGRMALVSDGVTAAFASSDELESNIVEQKTGCMPLRVRIAEINNVLTHKLEKGIDGEAGSLSAAVLLGSRHRLSDETVRDFARSGVSHLLALSGMHMAVLTGFFEFILRRLRVPKTTRCIMLPFVMLCYLCLTGFSLSAIRAAVMLSVVYVTFVTASPSDLPTTLFATCAGILCVSPSAAADAGFWMSFLATFGLVIILPHMTRLFSHIKEGAGIPQKLSAKLLKAVINAFLVTLTATFSVIFITWMCFGEVSVVSPLSNLVCVPAVMLQLILALLYLSFSAVPFVGGLIATASEYIGGFVLKTTGFISLQRNVTVSLEYRFAAVIIIAFTLTMAVLLVIRLKHKSLLLIPPVVAVLAYVLVLTVTNTIGTDRIEYTYLRRGEREMTVLTQNGSAFICDISEGAYSNFLYAWDAAHKEGTTELEVVMLTHYHNLHSPSLSKLFSSVRVRSVWLPEPKTADDLLIMGSIIEKAEAHGVSVTVFPFDTDLKIFKTGSIRLHSHGRLDRSLQPTIAFTVEYGDSRAVYTGSAYNETDRAESLSLDDTDLTVFGTHGPNPEQEFCIDSAFNAAELVFADRELLDLAYPTEAAVGNPVITYGCEYYKYTLKARQKN